MPYIKETVLKDGRKRYRVWYQHEGKQRTRLFDSREAAEAFDAEIKKQRDYRTWREGVRRQIERGEITGDEAVFLGGVGVTSALDEQMAVATYARRMVDADRELRPTTRALYERVIRHHLEPTELGRADIRQVQPADVSAWWSGLKDARTREPAGDGVRRQAQQLLARTFNRAVLVGDIEVSPLKRTPEVKRPRRKHKPAAEERLSLEQLRELADAAGAKRRGVTDPMLPARDRLLVLIMGLAGLREGEVGGLRASDIERRGTRCRIRVLRQVVRETGKEPYISEVKTDAARRTVPVPCSLADELDAFISAHGTNPQGHIFRKRDGRLVAAGDIASAINKAAKRIGLDVRGHQLRRTFASIAVENGANPEALRKMLGHASVQQTLDTYSHLFDWGADEIADSVEKAWNPG